jgi:transglutaminase-like putative cysteine protease
MPDPDRRVDAWARRVASAAGSKETLKVLEVMTHAIKEEFRYGARYEEGTQTAAQTLELGSGTGRDFAVLMMEALRSFGLATRFVTGYLYDDTSGTTRGGGSTHAWCSVYLPGAGWGRIRPDERFGRWGEPDPRGGDQGGRAGTPRIGWFYR